MNLRRIIIFFLTVAASILVVWILTPASIIPPADPVDGIAVHVVERGLHTSLVLPRGNNELMEYAYGDWNYFALNQQKLSDGLAALLIPTLGTIGRRQFTDITQLRQVVKQEDITLLSFKVAEAKATQLMQSLDKRFNRNINTRVENPHTGLTLVQDDQKYTLLHNSNHEVVAWLEDLDCQVKGFVMWANFRVQYPKN